MTKRNLLCFLLVAIFLLACNKQNKLYNTAVRGNGTWKVISHSYQSYQSGVPEENYTYENIGEIDFSINGMVYWKRPDAQGHIFTSSGTWTNSNDELILALEGEGTYAFKVTERKRSATMTLVSEHKDEEFNSVLTLKLERK